MADDDVTQHFTQTLGNVPAPIAALRDHAPEALEGYVALRRHVMADRPDGLDLATKELIFVLLDVVYDNEAGALNHLDAALAAGLSPQALMDALLEVLMVGGIQTWGKSGHRVLLAAVERTNSRNGDG